MKKFLLSASVILLFGLYVFSTTFNKSAAVSQQGASLLQQPEQQSPQTTTSTFTPVTPTTPAITPAPATSSNPTTAPVTPPMPVVTPVRRTAYKNGSFTGDSVDAYYGNVQVKAIIKGGKIADVQFLNYPQDRQHSVEISSYAMPLLTSEAIQAQNANVDIVSGATETSLGFQQSLASALSQATA